MRFGRMHAIMHLSHAFPLHSHRMQSIALTVLAASTGERARGNAVARDSAEIVVRVPDGATTTCAVVAQRVGEVVHLRFMVAGTTMHVAEIHATDGLIAHAGRPNETRAHKHRPQPRSAICADCGQHADHPIHDPAIRANLWRSTT